MSDGHLSDGHLSDGQQTAENIKMPAHNADEGKKDRKETRPWLSIGSVW